jgi:hypothetical protein
MPFRIIDGYWCLLPDKLHPSEPSEEALRAYIAWLKSETEQAELRLRQLKAKKEPAK